MEKSYLAPEEFQSRFRSKIDLYKLRTKDRNRLNCEDLYRSVYPLNYKNCPIHFLRKLLSGEKEASFYIDDYL